MEIIYSLFFHVRFVPIFSNSKVCLVSYIECSRALCTHREIFKHFSPSFALAMLIPFVMPYLLYFPLILLFLSRRLEVSETALLDRVVSRIHSLILPFVFTCIIRFVIELMAMKSPISKRKADLLYFLLTNRKVRQIREVMFFAACTPSYYSAFCLSRGFFHLNEIFIVIFGLLCILGVFGETSVVRIYAVTGVISSVLQYLFVKQKEKESLKYI